MAQLTPYITLSPKAKHGTIAGAGLLWFFHIAYTFSLPVSMPLIMQHYGIMSHYATLSALSALLQCLITPLGGKLGDQFGRRCVCLAAGTIRLALLLCCTVPTCGAVYFLLSSVGGAVGGLLYSLPYSILSDVTPLEERPRWFGLFGTINGVAMVLGLFFGGIIVNWFGPFSLFPLTSVFGAAALILLFLFYPNQPAQAPSPIDWGGIGLLAITLFCLMGWCSLGGNIFDRGSPFGISVLAVGFLFLFLLVRFERRAAAPLLTPRLFRNQRFPISFATQMLIPPMVYLCSSMLTLFGQTVLGLSAAASGTLAIPKNLLFCVLPMILGSFLARDSQRFRITFFLCGAGICLGSLSAAVWNASTPLIAIYFSMLFFGVGTSCQSVSIQPYMQIGMDPRDIGIATAMLQFGSSIGSLVFNAFYSIFYNARYATAVAAYGDAGIPVAVAQTFSALSLVTAVSGALIAAIALFLIPRLGKTVH